MSEALPLSPEDVRQAQESNGECRALTFFCQNGWPQKSKLPLHLSQVEPPPSEEQEPQRTLPPLEPQRITTVQSPDSLGLPSADSDRSHGVTRTRSGRRVVPPNRLNM
ncbi:hypothetical protein MRX96_022200 [Rhipicephalus microplus]